MLQPLLHLLDVDGCGHFASKVYSVSIYPSCKNNKVIQIVKLD